MVVFFAQYLVCYPLPAWFWVCGCQHAPRLAVLLPMVAYKPKPLIMKAVKITTLALALTFTLGFVACNETKEKDDDKIIQIETKERIIERDRDKVEVDVNTNDGKLDVGVDNDKKKIDVEIGRDKDDK